MISVSFSPDADDLFMAWALLEGRIDSPFDFAVDFAPTHSLNELASGNGADVVAISIAHYPRIAEHYLLLPHGGSMGEGYGPVVVAREPLALEDLRGLRVGVPGLTTTAWATLRMMVDVDPVVVPISPYQRIFEALRAGEVDAGLLIHEGRLTFEAEGFTEVVDLGAWWLAETGLPLPLGGNAIRRDLPDLAAVSGVLRESIRYALDHRDEAIDWLLSRGGALGTREQVDRYLSMYANARTLDYGKDGRAAVEAFLHRAATAGLLPHTAVRFAP